MFFKGFAVAVLTACRCWQLPPPQRKKQQGHLARRTLYPPAEVNASPDNEAAAHAVSAAQAALDGTEEGVRTAVDIWVDACPVRRAASGCSHCVCVVPRAPLKQLPTGKCAANEVHAGLTAFAGAAAGQHGAV